MSIFSTLKSAASSVGNAVGKGASAIWTGLKSVGNYVGGLASDGVYDATSFTMRPTQYSAEENAKRTSRKTHPFNLFINIILSPVTYLPGLILGFTIFPLVWYTGKNFYNLFDLTNDKIRQYAKPEKERNFKEFAYDGGPMQFFGLIGAALGITIGTILWTIPRTFFMEIIPNTAVNTIILFLVGWELATKDEMTFEEIYNNTFGADNKRSILAKALGYIPFGAPIGAIAFTLSLGVHTVIRVVSNTFKGFINSIVYCVDKALFETPFAGNDAPFIKQNNWKRFLGLTGYIIGGAIGTAIASIIIAFRVIIHSGENFYKWFSRGFFLPVNDKPSLQILGKWKEFNLDLASLTAFKNSFNFTWSEHVLGLPGHLLAPAAAATGILFGAGLRVAAESFRSTIDAGTFIVNKMVKYDREEPIKARKWFEPIIGALGYPVALVITPFTTLYANYDSAKRVLNSIVKPILNTKPTTADTRPYWVKFLTIPGAVIGGTMGAIARITVESSYKAYRTGQKMVKVSLIDNDYAKSDYLKPGAEPSEYSKYWGGLGYVVGGIFMTPVVLLIITGRFMLTNADSAKRSFAQQVNPKLTADSQIKNVDDASDARSERLKTIGKPGKALGFVAGYLGIVSIESAVYFEYTFKTILRGAAHQHLLEDNIQLNDINHHSKLAGTLGIISGAIVGVIAGGIFVSGRIIYNTGASIKNITADMVRFVWSGKDFNDINNSTMLAKLKGYNPTGNAPIDKRLNTPFRLGMIGIPIGGIVGSLALLTVGSLRIMAQTVVTTINGGLFYSRYALPFGRSKSGINYNINRFAIEQNQVDKGLGFVGKVTGLAFGAVGFVILGTIRLVVDTYISVQNAFIFGLKLPPVNYNYIPSVEDDRENTDKVLGIPGYIIGIPIGLIAYLGHIAVRIVIDSIKTGYDDAKKISLWTYGSEIDYLFGNQYLNTSKTGQTPFEKYGFGLPGHFIGSAIGVGVGAIILSCRFIAHQWRSLKLGFKKFANVTKFDENKTFFETPFNNRLNKIQLPFIQELTIPDRLLSAMKYISGIPGFAIGAAISATFVVLPRYVMKFAKNNRQSFLYLSGSLLNLGGEAYYYKGVGSDNRKPLNKVFGAPGYLLALCTAGLAPLANGALKIGLALLITIPTAPFVAIWKAYKIYFKPRFDGSEGNEQQKIKNLYSALQNGEFVPEQSIPEAAANGGKGSWDFIRKIFCLDEKTYVEKLLDAKLKISRDKFDYSELVKAVDSIKGERYSNFSIFNRKVKNHYNQDMENEVTATAQFIDDYLKGKEVVTPKSTKYNAFDLFFKGEENLSEDRKKELESNFGF